MVIVPRVYKKTRLENLEKELESQTKLINLKLNDLSNNLENFDMQSTFGNLQEIIFDTGETQIVVNAKLFLDINKSIEDINLKYLEQDIKNKLLEKKKEIISEAVKQANEQQVILRNHFERNIFVELERCENQAVKDTIQLLYNTGLFDSFENKDQIVNVIF